MIAELELHTIKTRLHAGLISKARRGDLAQSLPVGLVRDLSGALSSILTRKFVNALPSSSPCSCG